jgi:cysteine desulfurase
MGRSADCTVIYLDNNATTRPLPKVLEAMIPYLSHCYFNPSASTAGFTDAALPRKGAAQALANLLKAEGPECFIFTSGATESNNWVFWSISQNYKAGTVLVSEIEHPSVYEPAEALSRYGISVIKIPVNEQGTMDLNALESAVAPDTLMVSFMAANNETGVIQPLKEIGEIVRSKNPTAIIHTDAAQAVGKINIDLFRTWQDIDLMTFSAHKFHGPKGIGGLYIRPGSNVAPMLLGGGQEDGFRSGTTNTPGLAGLEAAASELNNSGVIKTETLRDQFESELNRLFPEVEIHGAEAVRLPNTSCFSLPGVVGDDLAVSLAADNVIIGTGSACSSGTIEPSKTLIAMGIDYETAKAALRISMGRFTSEEDIRAFFRSFCKIVSAHTIQK